MAFNCEFSRTCAVLLLRVKDWQIPCKDLPVFCREILGIDVMSIPFFTVSLGFVLIFCCYITVKSKGRVERFQTCFTLWHALCICSKARHHQFNSCRCRSNLGRSLFHGHFYHIFFFLFVIAVHIIYMSVKFKVVNCLKVSY